MPRALPLWMSLGSYSRDGNGGGCLGPGAWVLKPKVDKRISAWTSKSSVKRTKTSMRGTDKQIFQLKARWKQR